MSSFVDEARSRVAHLLRMASTEDPELRARIIAYAAATPDPPLMGRHGLATRGCPRCRCTMWLQWDGSPLWVCSRCGHVAENLAPGVVTAG